MITRRVRDKPEGKCSGGPRRWEPTRMNHRGAAFGETKDLSATSGLRGASGAALRNYLLLLWDPTLPAIGSSPGSSDWFTMQHVRIIYASSPQALGLGRKNTLRR